MEYLNLIILVVLTIILIFIIQAFYLEYKVPYLEGATTHTCNNPNLQKMLDNESIDYHSQCWQVDNLSELLNKAGIKDPKEISDLLHLFYSIGLKNLFSILIILSTFNQNFPDVNPAIALPQLIKYCSDSNGNFNINEFSDFFGLVMSYGLHDLQAPYVVFATSINQESIFDFCSKLGINTRTFFDLIEKHSNRDANNFCKFLATITNPSFNYVYTDSNSWNRLLSQLNMYSGSGPTSSSILDQATSFQSDMNTMKTTWGPYITAIDQITQLAGPQTDMVATVKAFVEYLEESPNNQPSYMVDIMNYINAQSGTNHFNYQNNQSTNLIQYWTNAKSQNLSLAQIIQNAKEGSYAYYYVNPNQTGFTGMNSSGSFSLAGVLQQIKYYLFGENEGFTNGNLSDYNVMQTFGISNPADLSNYESLMNQYTQNSNLSKSNTLWDNNIAWMYILSLIGVNNSNWPDYLKLLNDFGATTISQMKDVFTQLANIQIKNYSQASGFIQTIVQFKVYYSSNFTTFMQNINNFGFNPSSTQIYANFNTFINDLSNIGFDYTSSASQVNAIIIYLSTTLGYKLSDYSTNSNSRALIVKLNSYSANAYYGNALNDILLASTYVPSSMLSNNTENMRNLSAKILDAISGGSNNPINSHLNFIESFLTNDEAKYIHNTNSALYSADDITSKINSIQNGIQKYTSTLDPINYADEIKNNLSIILLLQAFPFAIFQILSASIVSQPIDGLINQLTNPNYSYSKSSYR